MDDNSVCSVTKILSMKTQDRVLRNANSLTVQAGTEVIAVSAYTVDCLWPISALLADWTIARKAVLLPKV